MTFGARSANIIILRMVPVIYALEVSTPRRWNHGINNSLRQLQREGSNNSLTLS